MATKNEEINNGVKENANDELNEKENENISKIDNLEKTTFPPLSNSDIINELIHKNIEIDVKNKKRIKKKRNFFQQIFFYHLDGKKRRI